MSKSKKIRVIITAAAALIASAGAVLFVKRKAIKRHFGIYSLIAAVILCGMMGAATTAYAANTPGADTEPETVISVTETDAEPDEDMTDADTEPEPGAEPDIDKIIETLTGEDMEIDIADFLNLFLSLAALEQPTRDTQFTPPGNMTLVDDFYSVATDKQFITVTTKNGNTFYIIIDRSGDKENVHFLNLVDEYDLLQIIQGEDVVPPPLPPDTPTKTEEPTESEGEPKPQGGGNTGLMLGILVIAAIGGGAFYFFKIRKPKQGGAGKVAVKSELDEFDFDEGEDDLFTNNADEPDTGEYDGDEDDIPDFTVKDEPEGGGDFTPDFGEETPESEDKQ